MLPVLLHVLWSPSSSHQNYQPKKTWACTILVMTTPMMMLPWQLYWVVLITARRSVPTLGVCVVLWYRGSGSCRSISDSGTEELYSCSSWTAVKLPTDAKIKFLHHIFSEQLVEMSISAWALFFKACKLSILYSERKGAKEKKKKKRKRVLYQNVEHYIHVNK